MTKYIEREKLVYDICKNPDPYNIGTVLRTIANQSIADVIPLVHGKWLHFNFDCQLVECSVCAKLYRPTFEGKENEASIDSFMRFCKYCPNCGAQMDGGADDN